MSWLLRWAHKVSAESWNPSSISRKEASINHETWMRSKSSCTHKLCWKMISLHKRTLTWWVISKLSSHWQFFTSWPLLCTTSSQIAWIEFICSWTYRSSILSHVLTKSKRLLLWCSPRPHYKWFSTIILPDSSRPVSCLFSNKNTLIKPLWCNGSLRIWLSLFLWFTWWYLCYADINSEIV